MNGKQLLRRYAAGERDFSGVDLKGANLSEISVNFVKSILWISLSIT